MALTFHKYVFIVAAIILIPQENILAIECPLEIGHCDYFSNLFVHDQLHDDEGDY